MTLGVRMPPVYPCLMKILHQPLVHLVKSRILERKNDLIKVTQQKEWMTICKGLEPVKITAPNTPSPDSHADPHNPNMSDFGLDAPLTKSWTEEEADGEGDLRT